MKFLLLVLVLVPMGLIASDPLMVDLLKKAAKEENKQREIDARKAKYKIEEKPGLRIIGISHPYYIIDGVQVDCNEVEVKCVNGRCTLVPKTQK